MVLVTLLTFYRQAQKEVCSYFHTPTQSLIRVCCKVNKALLQLTGFGTELNSCIITTDEDSRVSVPPIFCLLIEVVVLTRVQSVWLPQLQYMTINLKICRRHADCIHEYKLVFHYILLQKYSTVLSRVVYVTSSVR